MNQQANRTMEDLAREYDAVLIHGEPYVAKCATCGGEANVSMSATEQAFMVHCPRYFRTKNSGSATAYIGDLREAISIWNDMQADPWINAVKGLQ